MKQVTIPVSPLSLVMLYSQYGAVDIFKVKSTDTYRNRLLYTSSKKRDLRTASKIRGELTCLATFEVSNEVFNQMNLRDSLLIGWAVHQEDWEAVNSFLLGQVSCGIKIQVAVFNFYKVYRADDRFLRYDTIIKSFYRWRSRKIEKNLKNVVLKRASKKQRFDTFLSTQMVSKSIIFEFDLDVLHETIIEYFELEKSPFESTMKNKTDYVPKLTYIYIAYHLAGYSHDEIAQFVGKTRSTITRQLQTAQKWINQTTRESLSLLGCLERLFERIEEKQSLSYEIAREYIRAGVDVG